MSEILKKPYEISVWEDELVTLENGESYYKEKKLAIIGSNEMVSPSRVINPILKVNVNGEKTLTFSIEFRYYDEKINDIVSNPIYPLLINERKVKLYYNNSWYDFIIKEIEESKEENTVNYVLKDIFVNELSKQGYNIEFDQELNNNLGTVVELGKEVLKETNWQIDEDDCDLLLQKIDEPMYTCVTTRDFQVLNLDTNEIVTIENNETIYVFYSYVSQGEGEFLQFIRLKDKPEGKSWKVDDDNVITSTNYRYLGNFFADENNKEISLDEISSITIGDPFLDGKAYRLVYQKRTIYDPVMETNVEVLKANFSDSEQEIYKSSRTEYGTSTVVTSVISSGTNFEKNDKSGIIGWDGINLSISDLPSIDVTTYPPISKDSGLIPLKELNGLTSYLRLHFPHQSTKNPDEEYIDTIFNSGFMDHGARINNIIKGEEYSFRIRAGYGGENVSPKPFFPQSKLQVVVAFYETKTKLIQGVKQSVRYFKDDDIIFNFDGKYEEAPKIITGGTFDSNKSHYIIDRVVQNPSLKYYYQEENSKDYYCWDSKEEKFIPVPDNSLKYYVTTAKAKKTIPNKELVDPSVRIGIFFLANDSSITGNNYLYIDEVELFKTRYGSDKKITLPGNLPTSEPEEIFEYYLKPEEGVTKEDINVYSSLEDLANDLNIDVSIIEYLYNENGEKVLSIQESKSNCFNILQTLCETFECWLKISVEHEENGAIKLDKNYLPIKRISFKEYIGKDNFAGFRYGINLNSITRTLNSNEVVTKLIVLDSPSDYTDNGVLSISFADANPSKENIIYNFDYYIQKGLIKNVEQFNLDLNSLYIDIKILNKEIQRLEKAYRVANTAFMTVESYNTDYVEIRESTQKAYIEALADFQKAAGCTYETYLKENPDSVKESLIDNIGKIYEYANILNTNGGIITTTNQEYKQLKLELDGVQEYGITVSTTNEYTLDESEVPAITKLVLSGYIEGFSFNFERDGLIENFLTSINKKEFEVESEIPYKFLRILSLPEGYSLEYTINKKTYTVDKVGEIFPIYDYIENEGKVRRFKLVPSKELQEKYPGYQRQIKKKIEEKTQILKRFEQKYSQFIQEGTWESTSYIDSNLYYFDALQISHTSAKPQVSYNINVTEISEISGLENYYFEIGDKTYVEDTEFFGWIREKIDNVDIYTPVKEEVILSEIEWHLDDPSENIITVQNYKTQFEDLFQRISATVQSVEYNTANYSRAANLLNENGSIDTGVLIKSLNGIAGSNISLAVDGAVEFTKDGIIVKDLTSQKRYAKIIGRGIQVSNDGGRTWQDVVTADGITTNALKAGNIDTQKITIMDGDNTSFRWDKNGLSAYGFNEGAGYDLTSFVRMDKYGLYGIKNGGESTVTSLDDLLEKAHFSLTWDGFRIKNSYGNGYVSISSDNDFEVVKTEPILTNPLSLRAAANNVRKITKIKIGAIEKDEEGTPIKYGININNDNGEPVFSTDDDGNIIITGTINAAAGNIGGFTVGNELFSGEFGQPDSIYLSSGHNGILPVGGIDNVQSWVIAAGENFGVTGSGIVYAQDAVINGTVYATDGTFSGYVTAQGGKFEKDITIGTGEKYVKIAIPQNGDSLIASSDYIQNTSMGWAINGSGDAIFNNVSVRGAIKTAVFEYSEIEAVGGAFLFRPSSSIKTAEIDGDNLKLTVEKSSQFKQYEWVKVSNCVSESSSSVANNSGLTHVYQIGNNPQSDNYIVLLNAGKDFNTSEIIINHEEPSIDFDTISEENTFDFAIDWQNYKYYSNIFNKIHNKHETTEEQLIEGEKYYIEFDNQRFILTANRAKFTYVFNDYMGNEITQNKDILFVGNLNRVYPNIENTGEPFVLIMDNFYDITEDTAPLLDKTYYSINDSIYEVLDTTDIESFEDLSFDVYEYNDGIRIYTEDENSKIIYIYHLDNIGNAVEDLVGGALISFGYYDVAYRKFNVEDNNPAALHLYELINGNYVLTEDTQPVSGKDYYKELYENGKNNYGIGINSSDNYVGLPERAISLFESKIHPDQSVKVTYDYKGILGTLPSNLSGLVNNNVYQHMAGTQGIFTNNMYIGDNTQYLAFYTDKNGNKQLKIKANQVVYEVVDEDTGQVDWKDVKDSADGEDAITVIIDSSTGNMFVRQDVRATLTCHVYQGSGMDPTHEITNKVTKFTWVKYDKDGIKDDSWVRLPGSQSITIGPEDIASKAIFKCEVEF